VERGVVKQCIILHIRTTRIILPNYRSPTRPMFSNDDNLSIFW
jgi:hypothetical protein